jgi:uncharacterized protein YciI
MYALAILRYRKPLEEVIKHVDAHRAYLGGLKAKGVLLASGPLDPRTGGALLLRVPDDAVDATLDGVRDGDPFFKAGVAQYELLPWAATIGIEGLDRL